MKPTKEPQNRKPAAFAFMSRVFVNGGSLSVRDVASEFGCSIRTAQRWLAEYNEVVEPLDWDERRAVLR